MPQVKTHKLMIRDYSDVAIYVPSYEKPLAMRKHRKARKGAKPDEKGPIYEEPLKKTTPVALATRTVDSIEQEYVRCVRIYGAEMVMDVYPDKADFVAAVEKAMLSFTSQATPKSEILVKFKQIGLTEDQAKRCDARGLDTLEKVQKADLAALSKALEVTADRAQELRQKWWGEKEPIVVPDADE